MPGYGLALMASPLGWLRALLALFQQRSQAPDHSWVEPGNAITRAVLTGDALIVQAVASAPNAVAPAYPDPAVATQADVYPEPTVAPEPAAAAELPAEAPAAEQQEKSGSPRKAGRAA